MRLLIVTQKVDTHDPILGFFHGWIMAFARVCSSVVVICLEQGNLSLPANVRVQSLGKESKPSRLRYLFRFFSFLIRERHAYDAVLVHMNPEYVLLGAPLWKLFGKPVGLWYAHGYTPWTLRAAAPLVFALFTSTPGGCRLKKDTIRVVGQGINTELFTARAAQRDITRSVLLITVGRISAVKHLEVLIQATRLVQKKGYTVTLSIIGNPVTDEDRRYHQTLLTLIREQGLSGCVHFLGPKTNEDLVSLLHAADIFINASTTGSLDKVLVEAMATMMPVVSGNPAYAEILPESLQRRLVYPPLEVTALCERILALMRAKDCDTLCSTLRSIVVRDHSIDGLIHRIVSFYEKN